MNKQLRAWIAVSVSFFAGVMAAEAVSVLEQRRAAAQSQEMAAPGADTESPARFAAALHLGGRNPYEAHE